MAMRIIGYPLPADVEEDLISHCEATGDNPAAVVIDAVTLFLDDALDAAETVPPPRVKTGRGLREGYAASEIGQRFARVMSIHRPAARRALRGEAEAG